MFNESELSISMPQEASSDSSSSPESSSEETESEASSSSPGESPSSESAPESQSIIEIPTPHPLWTTPLEDYTVTEGLLFLAFVVAAFVLVFKIFK